MRARSPGFTILELMIVVTIIGLLTAMAAATANQLGARNATQNAAADLSSILQNARARAEQRGSDVYVIVYPTMDKTGATTGGGGAVFVYEDSNGDFLKTGGACGGTGALECTWDAFVPPSAIYPPPVTKDRFVQAIYLDNYPKQNARFGKVTGAYAAPFGGIGTLADTNGCSFCATGAKGAIVFTGEQQLQFLNNAGAPQAQRVAGLAVQGKDNPNNTFLFGLVAATGLVTLVK